MCFLAALSSALSQDLNLDCYFSLSWEYECSLNHIEVLDPSQNVVFGGEHIGNRTNDEVRIVRISNSETPFIIQQIFTTFPNIIELYIYNSNLQSIDIPHSIHLTEIYIYGNNISRIENGTFEDQTNVLHLNLRDNGIQEVDEGAFVGLEHLTSLNLIGNHIRTFEPRTFHPLRNLTLLDLERNNLTSIGDDWFSQNPLISILYFEYNQIEEISPRLMSSFENLLHIDLSGNACIDRSFYLDSNDDFSVIVLHNALRSCYNNFIGEVSDLRRVILEFEGPLKLFDEFGNLVASL